MRSVLHGLLPAAAAGMVIIAAITACGDTLGPRADQPAPALQIRDAVHGSGNAHFYFLPPLVRKPAYAGDFDATVTPTVDVCEWSGSACVATIAAFSMIGGTGSETIRVDHTAQTYKVNWHTDRCTTGTCVLDPSKTYRIRVLVLETELGHADVDVVSRGNELKNVDTGEFIPLLSGRTLPIAFRIEKGALFVAMPSATETQVFATPKATDGSSVTMVVPPGGMSEPTAITMEVVSATEVATDERLASKTVYEFGPDGAIFPAPLTVSISYDPATLAPGTDETKLVLFWTEKQADGSIKWKPVPGSTVDVANHVVTGEVSHFSYGTIGVNNCDTTPTSDELTLAAGDVVELTATLCDDAGQPIQADSVVWQLTDEASAVLTRNWNTSTSMDDWTLRGIASGEATLTGALYDYNADSGFSIAYPVQTRTVTVTPQVVGSATFEREFWLPVGWSPMFQATLFTPAGDSAQLLAYGDVEFVAVDPGIFVLDSAWFATGSIHSVMIYGVFESRNRLAITSGSFSDTAYVNVTRVASLEVTGDSVLINPLPVGAELSLTAVVRDAWGEELVGRTVTWVSSDTGVATIDSSGLLRAVSAGTTEISATIDGQRWTRVVTVGSFEAP